MLMHEFFHFIISIPLLNFLRFENESCLLHFFLTAFWGTASPDRYNPHPDAG